MSVLIASCAPVLRQYHEPQSNVGELYPKGCSGSGPNDTLKLDLANNLSLKVWSSSESRIENRGKLYFVAYLDIPENVKLKFVTTEVTVSSQGIADLIIPIKSLSRFIDIGEIEVKPIEEDFIGSTKVIKRLFNEWPAHRTYKLDFVVQLDDFLEQYFIQLPEFTINDKHINLPRLEFKYVERMGVDPLNC